LEEKIHELNKKILKYEQDKKELKEVHTKEIISFKNQLGDLKNDLDSKDNKNKILESE